MLNFPPSVRIFICTQPTDMRKSFDGLSMRAEYVVGLNPRSGHLFVFINKPGDKLKILYWDRDGYAVWYKRLEKGTFLVPASTGEKLEVSAMDLAMILDGIDLSSIKRRKRFSLSSSLTE